MIDPNEPPKAADSEVLPVAPQFSEESPVSKKTSKKSSSQKKEKPSSVEELIASALKTRRLPFAFDQLRKVKDRPQISAEARIVLLGEARKHDETLDLARQLMIASLVMADYPMVSEEFREFARSVFAHHHCLQGMGEAELFPPRDSHVVDDLIKMMTSLRAQRDRTSKLVATAISLVGTDNAGEKLQEDSKALKKACDNAMIALVLWRYGTGRLSASAAIAALQEYVFPVGKMLDREVEAQSLRLVANSSDSKGMAALLNWFSDRIDSERKASEDIRRMSQRFQYEATELRTRNAELSEREAELESEIEAARLKLAALQDEMEKMKEEARVKGVHHTDDLSQMRSRVVRLLEDEMDLLSESLTALSREKPKVSVALEYIGDVHDRLAAELNRLREE